MGYCAFPIFLGCLTIYIMGTFKYKSNLTNFIIACVTFFWSTLCKKFLNDKSINLIF